MKIHIIQHESFESPGAIATWAQNRRHTVTYSRIYQQEALPENSAQFDFLIVMGGPQSPVTTLQECPYFNAQAEIELIRSTIKADKYLLGVCLGAQLVGEAFGCSFAHSPNKEIGAFPIHLTAEAAQDSIFVQFPKTFTVGHWHGDMPGISSQTAVLAYSEGCPRQIVRYSPKAYGFQCHMEFTQEAIVEMIKHSQKELTECAGLPYVQSVQQLKAHHYQEMNAWLFQFLDAFVSS